MGSAHDVKASSSRVDEWSCGGSPVTLLAFFGALAWLIVAGALQHTKSACYPYSHYGWSTGVALLLIVIADVTMRLLTTGSEMRRNKRALEPGLLIESFATTVLAAAGLAAGAFFLAIASCSGG